MRIFNGTNSVLTLPLAGNQQLTVNPKSVSMDFMGGEQFISMLVTSMDSSEIAIIVSGPYEINICANVPTAVNYVVQTLDEAIIKFGLKKEEKKEEHKESCECSKCCKEEKAEEQPIIEEEVKEEKMTETGEVEETPEVEENTAVEEEEAPVDEVVEKPKRKKRTKKS